MAYNNNKNYAPPGRPRRRPRRRLGRRGRERRASAMGKRPRRFARRRAVSAMRRRRRGRRGSAGARAAACGEGREGGAGADRLDGAAHEEHPHPMFEACASRARGGEQRTGPRATVRRPPCRAAKQPKKQAERGDGRRRRHGRLKTFPTRPSRSQRGRRPGPTVGRSIGKPAWARRARRRLALRDVFEPRDVFESVFGRGKPPHQVRTRRPRAKPRAR